MHSGVAYLHQVASLLFSMEPTYTLLDMYLGFAQFQEKGLCGRIVWSSSGLMKHNGNQDSCDKDVGLAYTFVLL